jgi:lipopolysaccharide export system ATP-binding protein
MPFLEVKNLSQTLGKKDILKSISFAVDAGQVVAFLGPNGAGKTTLLKTVIGLHPTKNVTRNGAVCESTTHVIATHGGAEQNADNQILLAGKEIQHWPVYKRIEEGLVYLPQQTSLFQQLSVQDNLAMVFEYQTYWKTSTKKDFLKERDIWLEITTLTQTLKQKAGTLSGGQKRKLEVVRSLLMHPKIIMLDEPFAGVDPKSIYELKKIFTDTAKSGIAILISDHNVEQLLSIAQLVYVIINGQNITSGGIKEIIENNFTKEYYFGNQFYNEISQKYL